MARFPDPAPGLVFRYDCLRPRLHEEGVETKAYVGLPADKPSWAIVSEVNIDSWASAGLALGPGTGEFAYPCRLPAPLLSAITRRFLQLRVRKLVRGLTRHP